MRSKIVCEDTPAQGNLRAFAKNTPSFKMTDNSHPKESNIKTRLDKNRVNQQRIPRRAYIPRLLWRKERDLEKQRECVESDHSDPICKCIN